MPSSARAPQYGTTPMAMCTVAVDVADDTELRRLVQADEHGGVHCVIAVAT